MFVFTSTVVGKKKPEVKLGDKCLWYVWLFQIQKGKTFAVKNLKIVGKGMKFKVECIFGNWNLLMVTSFILNYWCQRTYWNYMEIKIIYVCTWKTHLQFRVSSVVNGCCIAASDNIYNEHHLGNYILKIALILRLSGTSICVSVKLHSKQNFKK